jgi:hypothetical protein
MNKQTLLPGQYMKTTSVLQFISKWFPTQILKIQDLKKHEGEFDVYFSTADLQSVISIDIFREMECDCVTHIISKEQFSIIPSQTLNVSK